MARISVFFEHGSREGVGADSLLKHIHKYRAVKLSSESSSLTEVFDSPGCVFQKRVEIKWRQWLSNVYATSFRTHPHRNLDISVFFFFSLFLEGKIWNKAALSSAALETSSARLLPPRVCTLCFCSPPNWSLSVGDEIRTPARLTAGSNIWNTCASLWRWQPKFWSRWFRCRKRHLQQGAQLNIPA